MLCNESYLQYALLSRLLQSACMPCHRLYITRRPRMSGVCCVARRLSSIVMAVQMKAHTLKQRLCFTRPMRILLKFMRNMSCAVRDFQIFPSILPKVWLDAQQDFWDGFGELIQHDPHGVVYIPTATLMAELPGATAKENKIELAQRKWFNAFQEFLRQPKKTATWDPPLTELDTLLAWQRSCALIPLWCVSTSCALATSS